MKNIKILLFLFIAYNCSSQNPVINILDDDGSAIQNAYYKDIDNLLNQFQGTYLYTNGTTSFKIILVKKIMQYNGEYYEDLIIGEYQYIENGIEIVNTLSEINTNYPDQQLHNIDGNMLVNKNNRFWVCPDCGINEKRLKVSIKDASTNRYASMMIRKQEILDLNGNTQEVININITHVRGYTYIEGEPLPEEFSLPLGIFTLTKQ